MQEPNRTTLRRHRLSALAVFRFSSVTRFSSFRPPHRFESFRPLTPADAIDRGNPSVACIEPISWKRTIHSPQPTVNRFQLWTILSKPKEKIDELVQSRKADGFVKSRWQVMQLPRSEAFIFVCCNDEECSATQIPGFLRSRQD